MLNTFLDGRACHRNYTAAKNNDKKTIKWLREFCVATQVAAANNKTQHVVFLKKTMVLNWPVRHNWFVSAHLTVLCRGYKHDEFLRTEITAT